MEPIRTALSGKNFMRNVVGIICLLFSFSLIVACLFVYVPVENKEIRVQVLTFAITTVALVAGYYYTTSQSSTDKNDLLNAKP